MRGVLALAAVVAVAAGCGGQKALPTHAGLNEVEAREFALSAIGREIRRGDSPLHGHRVELESLEQGRSADGGQAWVARVSDLTDGTTACLRLWALKVRLYDYEWTECEGGEDDEEPPATTGDLPA